MPDWNRLANDYMSRAENSSLLDNGGVANATLAMAASLQAQTEALEGIQAQILINQQQQTMLLESILQQLEGIRQAAEAANSGQGLLPVPNSTEDPEIWRGMPEACLDGSCDYFMHYLVRYDHEKNGEKLAHFAYHQAEKFCEDYQTQLSAWEDAHPDKDPYKAAPYLVKQAEYWERRVAA
jgi:hypothetical protein